jgi:prepilin-type N-terminal cleavage/methylation domain-containing protein
MRFKDQKTSGPASGLRRRITNDNCNGFALIELLAATAIIAVLIALLLPVIQRAREEYARKMAADNLRALLVASNEYFQVTGSYPRQLADLSEYCSANPGSCQLSAELLSGRAGGYAYDFDADGDVDGADFLAVAEPEFPGITGSVTLTIDRNGVITSTPTPGADAAREQAFDDLLGRAADTAAQLLKLDPNAISEVRGYVGMTTVNAGTLASVFDTLDADKDGEVSISEVMAIDNTLGSFSPTLKGFLDALYRDLKWDSLSNEDRQAIAVGMSELDTSQPLLLSYDGLGNLTSILINWGDGNAEALIAKLEAAEAAEAIGDLKGKSKALKQYRNLVKAERGRSLTRAEANILITISNTL